MSIYNMVSKVSPATFFILPLLGIGHPDDWPKFKDCFVTARRWTEVDDIPRLVVVNEKEKPTCIYILLRIGGVNRLAYARQIAGLQSHPNYIHDLDDEYDPNYAHFVFSVPEEWKDDYDKAVHVKYEDTSEKYQHLIKTTFPKLLEAFEELFKKYS